MRVCLVSRPAPSPLADGHARYVWEAATALLAAGHEVHLLTGAPENSPDDAIPAPTLPAGLIVHTVDLHTGPATVPQAYPTPQLRHAMGVYAALLRLHGAHPFDAIEFPSADGEGYFALRGKRMLGQFVGAVLCVRLSTPAADVRRENLDSRFSGEAAFADHMETACIREADLLVSPTAALLDLVRSRREDDAAWPVPATAIIPPPRLPRATDGSWRRPDGPAMVLAPGPLETRRGVRALVEAAGELLDRDADLRFLCLGRDTETAPIGRPMRAFLKERYPQATGGRITFETGPVDPDRLHAALSAAAAVCFPGVIHEPEWAMLDAAALGVPVVTASSAGDAPGLASALLDALEGEATPVHACTDGAEFAAAFARTTETARAAGADQPPAADPATGGTPDVSVIVTVYNLGRYLPETLASLDAQTLHSREVILVDDGSTDAVTIDLVDRLEREGRRIIRQSNRGSAAARNVGLRAARGRWVVFIDADDLLDPTYLEKLAGVLRRNPRLSYTSSLVRCFENDDPSIATAGWVPLGMAGFDRDLLLCMNVGGIGAGSLFGREALLAVGGYDERMPSYEDWELWCRLAERGCRGAIVPEFIFSYRTRADSKYRRQGLARHAHLKSHILAHHAGDGLVTSRTVRLLLSEAAASDTALRAVHDHLESLNHTLRQVQEAKDDLARRTAEAEANVGVAWRHAGELERLLQKTAAELTGAQARAQHAAAELDAERRAAAEHASTLEHRAAESQRRIEHESAERARLEARLDQATTQTLLTGEQLTRARADLAQAQQALAELRQQIATHDCGVHTRQVLAENVRYRVADRVNSAIRGTGVHSAAKALARRTITNGEHKSNHDNNNGG